MHKRITIGLSSSYIYCLTSTILSKVYHVIKWLQKWDPNTGAVNLFVINNQSSTQKYDLCKVQSRLVFFTIRTKTSSQTLLKSVQTQLYLTKFIFVFRRTQKSAINCIIPIYAQPSQVVCYLSKIKNSDMFLASSMSWEIADGILQTQLVQSTHQLHYQKCFNQQLVPIFMKDTF